MEWENVEESYSDPSTLSEWGKQQ